MNNPVHSEIGNSLFSNIPAQMQAIANDIISAAGSVKVVYCVEMTFINGNFSVEVPIISSIVLEEMFETKVNDVLEIDFSVPISAKIALERLYKDLKCNLKFYLMDPTSEIRSKKPVFEILWNVIILNRGNTFHTLLPKQLLNSIGGYRETLRAEPMTVQLYNPGAVEIRSRKTAGIYRNVNVQDMIYHISNLFGVKTIDLIAPQNTNVYENFILEPMHYILDIFDYIQNRYGIYQRGVSIYYNGLDEDSSKLVVYPKYEYEPPRRENDNEVEILFVGQGNLLSGHNSYKTYSPIGEDVTFNNSTLSVSGTKIICNSVVSQATAADSGADTIGTISLVFNANKTVDKWRTIESDTKNRAIPRHKDDIIDGMKEDKGFIGFTSCQYNPRYDVSYNNAYRISSTLASVNCDLLQCRWHGAKPWTFYPGQRVTFTYGTGADKDVVKVPCICAGVSYSFLPIQATNIKLNLFECEANYLLKLSRIR